MIRSKIFVNVEVQENSKISKIIHHVCSSCCQDQFLQIIAIVVA